MQSRQRYLNRFEARLEEIEAELRYLQNKAANADGVVKADILQEIERLREKQAQLEQRLGELRDARHGVWRGPRLNAEQVWKELHDDICSARRRFE